ncbi:MAG: hypothetical protein KatS3mg018_0543 [Fimbriimonadales bacterium]|nr:MAG: hypothetical protein KatS3mg018_0543 [Fimbriimonadales bacterium]
MSLLEIRTEGTVDDWGLLRWTNSAGDALPVPPPSVGAVNELPPAPFGVAYPPPLEGVGRIYLWADGFTTREKSLTLERALAMRYLKAASALVKQYARRGVDMAAAQQPLQQAQAAQQANEWAECLARSVAAAEAAVVGLARAKLQRMHGRSAFLWGVVIDDAACSEALLDALKPPLNLMTLRTLAQDGATRPLLEQSQRMRLSVAAFWSECTLLQQSVDRLRDAVASLRGGVRYWNIAANLHRCEVSAHTTRQLTMLCEAGRTADFGITRLLHGKHGFYESQSPHDLLGLCVETGVPFEAVHLEWRWYDGSLYDLDALLERYGELGKPIHLTLHLPPENGYGVFSRAEPMRWIEEACLIALSKPYVIALQVPLRASEQSGGALEGEQPSPHWQRIAQVAVWNALLQD